MGGLGLRANKKPFLSWFSQRSQNPRPNSAASRRRSFFSPLADIASAVENWRGESVYATHGADIR